MTEPAASKILAALAAKTRKDAIGVSPDGHLVLRRTEIAVWTVLELVRQVEALEAPSPTELLKELQETVEHQRQICDAVTSPGYVNAINWFLELIEEKKKEAGAK